MKKIEHILVLTPITGQQKQELEQVAPACHFTYRDHEHFADDPEAEALLAKADVIIGNVEPKKVAVLPRLQWLQLFSAGANNYIEAGQFPEQVLLTNASGAYGLAISEHMLGMLLSLQKKLHLYRDNQNSQVWQDMGGVTALEGAVTLVIGLGDIGGDFARKMKALGSYTIGVRRHASLKPPYLDELHLTDAIDDLIPKADVIALSLPENRETRSLLNRQRLEMTRPGAIVLNVGRGSAIDQDALADGLISGHLGGAGLDVTDPEPLPAGHRLWTCKNALITPHVSGGFHLKVTQERIIQIAIENLKRFLKGDELVNQVDMTTGYRRFTGQ